MWNLLFFSESKFLPKNTRWTRWLQWRQPSGKSCRQKSVTLSNQKLKKFSKKKNLFRNKSFVETIVWTRTVQLQHLCRNLTARNLVFVCSISQKKQTQTFPKEMLFRKFLWIRARHFWQSWRKFVEYVWNCFAQNPLVKTWVPFPKFFRFMSKRSCRQIYCTLDNLAESFPLKARFVLLKIQNNFLKLYLFQKKFSKISSAHLESTSDNPSRKILTKCCNRCAQSLKKFKNTLSSVLFSPAKRFCRSIDCCCDNAPEIFSRDVEIFFGQSPKISVNIICFEKKHPTHFVILGT